MKKILLVIPLILCFLMPLRLSKAEAQISCRIKLDQTSVAAGSSICATWTISGASPTASVQCFWTLSEYGSPTMWYDADATRQPVSFTPSYGSSGTFEVIVSEPSGQSERFTEHFLVTQGGLKLYITASLDKKNVSAGSPISATWEVRGGVPPYVFDCGWETDEANAGFSVQPFRASRQERTDNSATAWPEIGDVGRFWVVVTDKNGRNEFYEESFTIVGGRLLSQRVADIASQCRAKASGDYARAKWLFDYLERIPNVGGTTMLHSSPHCILMLGTGLCESYATAYDLLCSQVGVQSQFIGGSSGGEGHAWVLVKLGDSWYHADPTWGAGYFLLSDEEASQTREWNRSRYPACPVPYGQSMPGDATNNGIVDILDLVAIIDWIVSETPCVSMENANANGIGVVDILDLVWVIDQIVGG